MTTKRRQRHSPEQIVRKLRDAHAMLDAGKDVATAEHKRGAFTPLCRGAVLAAC